MRTKLNQVLQELIRNKGITNEEFYAELRKDLEFPGSHLAMIYKGRLKVYDHAIASIELMGAITNGSLFLTLQKYVDLLYFFIVEWDIILRKDRDNYYGRGAKDVLVTTALKIQELTEPKADFNIQESRQLVVRIAR